MKLNIVLRGITPLLQHSALLADSQNPIVKEMKKITAKKKNKTDDDEEHLAYLEFRGGLYFDELREEVFIPDLALEECFRKAATQTRTGKDAAHGLEVLESNPALIYDGPKQPKALFEDKNFVDRRAVAVQKSRVMRTRPRFNQWAVAFTLNVDETIVRNKATVKDWLDTAGLRVGLGDFRPGAPKPGKFGRFIVERMEEV